MQIQKSHKGMEYIDVKLAAPWMGKRPAYADDEVLFSMGLEHEDALNIGYITQPILAQFAENNVPPPGKTRIRAREGLWQMYGEDDGIAYRIHKAAAGLEVHSTVVDMENTRIIPMTRVMAETLIGRKTAIPVRRKGKRTTKATVAPEDKKAVAINNK